MLREMRSFVFTVQTVGRILRMPELRHYTLDALNVGYIYTNMPTFSIQGEESFGYIVINSAKRKGIYIDIDLPSVHSKRRREETRLSPHFISCFLTAADELKLKDNISLGIKEISKTLISDVKVEDIDKAKTGKMGAIAASYITDKGNQVYLAQQETEIQHTFELFLIDCLKPLYPEPRSIDKMKQAIYSYFRIAYPLQYVYGDQRIQSIVLHESNSRFFGDAINKAKELYLSTVGKAKSELISDGNWNVPPYLNYPDTYSSLATKLSIVEPFYQRNDSSQVERDFTNHLESRTGEIEWWYKNGENDAKHLAIPYDDKGIVRPFYIDWIVKYKNGKLALFDTKAGITAETAKSKAEGLYRYIEEQNSKGKNLFGGIVINKAGSWRYNDNEIYEYDAANLKSWRYLG